MMMTLMKKFKKLLNKSILKFNKIYIVNRVRLFDEKIRSRKNIKFVSLNKIIVSILNDN